MNDARPAGALPYGKQSVDDDDVQAVMDVLRSDWLTTGPKVDEFERAVAETVGAKFGVAVSSGTAALHAAMRATGVGPGDEVIVPAITFAASANAVVYEGATPIFADVLHETLLVDPSDVERKITSRTKAIVSVDYAGQPCDYDVLGPLAAKAGAKLVADGCHALGARLGTRFVGSLADLTAFSFHPVKHITTGEGGMVVTNDPKLAGAARRFRNHGISTEYRERAEQGTWRYDMVELGYNYRISDLQCALGLSQLRKLTSWVTRRQEIAKAYDQAFAGLAGVTPLTKSPHVQHAYHLYVVRLSTEVADRQVVFSALREAQIGVNVHYLPVYLHSFYRERFGTEPGLCPVAEEVYEEILSLPMFPTMSDADVDRVVEAFTQAVGG